MDCVCPFDYCHTQQLWAYDHSSHDLWSRSVTSIVKVSSNSSYEWHVILNAPTCFMPRECTGKAMNLCMYPSGAEEHDNKVAFLHTSKHTSPMRYQQTSCVQRSWLASLSRPAQVMGYTMLYLLCVSASVSEFPLAVTMAGSSIHLFTVARWLLSWCFKTLTVNPVMHRVTW